MKEQIAFRFNSILFSKPNSIKSTLFFIQFELLECIILVLTQRRYYVELLIKSNKTFVAFFDPRDMVFYDILGKLFDKRFSLLNCCSPRDGDKPL